jgi:hypothetical protein
MAPVAVDRSAPVAPSGRRGRVVMAIGTAVTTGVTRLSFRQ